MKKREIHKYAEQILICFALSSVEYTFVFLFRKSFKKRPENENISLSYSIDKRNLNVLCISPTSEKSISKY